MIRKKIHFLTEHSFNLTAADISAPLFEPRRIVFHLISPTRGLCLQTRAGLPGFQAGVQYSADPHLSPCDSEHECAC